MKSNWNSKPCPQCLNYMMDVYTTDDKKSKVIIVCTNCGRARKATLATKFVDIPPVVEVKKTK